MTKRPLGRGLSALLPTDLQLADSEELLEVGTHLIRTSHDQPRTKFDQAKLEELAQSIRASGVIQPLIVRRRGGMFELVAGERRWRAAQIAGLHSVPVIVRDIPDDRLLELALVENIQREDLNPVEEARAYSKLIEGLALTQEEVARRVGRDRSFVTNYLRILKLPADIQSLIESEKISFGHARALLAVDSPTTQRRLAQKIAKNNWSVRETERRVRSLSRESSRSNKRATVDPNLVAAEARLRRHLATQVRLVSNPSHSGTIEIDYYNLSDLERIYRLILGSETKSAIVGVT
jgi:ParB family transcriptional regulator, chromosome partitioning protein